MESNALKVHMENPEENSRRMQEAIRLVLFDIKEKTEDTDYALNDFRDENNQQLEHVLLMAFDPFTNPEVKEVLKSDLTKEELKEYYFMPIRCLLRIAYSVNFWIKERGSDGYSTTLIVSLATKWNRTGK